ncbi:twin-arginine translocase subunit TatC [Aminobacter sp. UC22_36]|uniref:twin-arginine translocase subunit TatC n=1 Tax=Aminobacter sp. UC22_36 TaxID=3374549 RepID=UPI003757A599
MSAEDDEIEKSSAPLMEHLIELRTRLMWSIGGFFVAFLVCFFFAKQLFNLLVIPFKWATKWAGLDPHKVELIYTAPQEFFFTQIKLAMFGGLVIAFPVIAAQIYKFVAPGLYKNERAAFLPFLIASPVLFLMGASLVYFFFTPMVMWFFLAMQQAGTDDQVQISLLPKVSEYLSLIMTLIFSFGLVFQLPVVTTLMARVGMVTSQGLADKRKWAIVIAFVVAAVLTPPDPVSQIGLALPTILLYEISIWTARMIERKREQDRVASESRMRTKAPQKSNRKQHRPRSKAQAAARTPADSPIRRRGRFDNRRDRKLLNA